MQRLKSKDRWLEANLGKDVISLTQMICDLAHLHDDTTQGTMAIVASDMALYTTYTSKSETPVSIVYSRQMWTRLTPTVGVQDLTQNW